MRFWGLNLDQPYASHIVLSLQLLNPSKLCSTIEAHTISSGEGHVFLVAESYFSLDSDEFNGLTNC